MNFDAERGVMSRRRLLGLLTAGSTALMVSACARRDEPPAVGAVPPAAAATSVPTVAAPVPPTAAPASANQVAPAASTATSGGTITAAVQNDWVTFDMIYNTAEPTAAFSVFDPYLFFAPDTLGNWQPTPGLIEQWETSDRALTVHLRKGVTFHDGTDWNVDAFKWNLDRQLHDPKSLGASVLEGVDLNNPLTSLDSYTAQINLTHPAPALLTGLASYYLFPVSPAAFQKLGADQFGRNPVGTGPYKFKEWRRGDRILLERNDSYWMKDSAGKSLPYLDGITYRLIADDSVRSLELKAHNIDFADLLPGKDIPSIKADSSLTFVDGPWCGNCYRVVFDAKAGPFADNLKLRQAALYAIDRDAVAKTIGQGAGTPTRYFLGPGAMGYDENLPYYDYQPDKAKQLLQDAGYASGLDFTYTVISREADNLMGQMLKQMWETVGLRANVDVLERAAWVQALLGTAPPQFQAGSMRNGRQPGDPDADFRKYMSPKGSFNVAHQDSKELNDALDRGDGTYDLATRTQAYKDVQRVDFNLAYYGYVWMQNWNWVMNRRLNGVPPSMYSSWDFRGARLSA